MLIRTILATLIVDATLAAPTLAQTHVAPDRCAATAEMQVYSNVFIHKETGDLLGYDLAIKLLDDSRADALLYVYEGGEAGDGIPLTGKISNKQLTLSGTWVERLTEYPSKKEIVEKHGMTIRGILGSADFRGELSIGDIAHLDQVRLRRVKNIWSCQNRSPHVLK
jgi:hypothetical protein